MWLISSRLVRLIEPARGVGAASRLAVSLLPLVDAGEQAGDLGNRRPFGCHSIRAGHPSSSTIFRPGRLLAPSMVSCQSPYLSKPDVSRVSTRVSAQWINPTGISAQAQPRFCHRFGRDPKYAEMT